MNNAYFGDLHVHTKISIDSFLRKNMLTMADAYRFAKGAAVTVAGGETVQLSRPLDFVALTDHAESFHTFDLCTEGTGPESRTPMCLAMKQGDNSLNILFQNGGEGGPRDPDACPGKTLDGCRAVARDVWKRIQEMANAQNQPGKFTAFIGYEYSGTLPGSGATGGHLHRNVIFRGPSVTPDARNSMDERTNADLWRYLDQTCAAPCEVMAIPHNTNLSWGFSFALETQDRKPYETVDWQRRARFERLAEIFQIKGNSECAVGFGTSDEECGFNTLPYPACQPGQRLDRCYGDGSFVRNALQNGLKQKDVLGFNPYKLGFVASTDNHNAIPGAAAEKNYVGSIGVADGSPALRLQNQINRNPGGLTGIWAPENTRDALFDAMKRRETFGTSGPRIEVRLFGGWSYDAALVSGEDWIAKAYRAGAPMGGDLPAPGAGQSMPHFIVWAKADPEGARLQRIQIVKGWLEGGQSRETIYDVVCSDGLTPDAATHRCPDNGAKVDLKDCSYSRDKGAAELKTLWTDPDFGRGEPSFYYARVFENPTCRWSAYDALKLGRPIPPIPAPAQQERAWSSPIWYEPAK